MSWQGEHLARVARGALSCLPMLVSTCAIFAALIANFVVRFDLGYRGCVRSWQTLPKRGADDSRFFPRQSLKGNLGRSFPIAIAGPA